MTSASAAAAMMIYRVTSDHKEDWKYNNVWVQGSVFSVMAAGWVNTILRSGGILSQKREKWVWTYSSIFSSPLRENLSWLICTSSVITHITHQPNGNPGNYYTAPPNQAHPWKGTQCKHLMVGLYVGFMRENGVMMMMMHVWFSSDHIRQEDAANDISQISSIYHLLLIEVSYVLHIQSFNISYDATVVNRSGQMKAVLIEAAILHNLWKVGVR